MLLGPMSGTSLRTVDLFGGLEFFFYSPILVVSFY